MTDLTTTIAPKSDQLNADDLIGRDMTITVTAVRLLGEPDQPVAINFEGDNGKPYKPCKSMRRVLVQCWGGDGNAYAGRRMTLYRDPGVKFGGLEVGGIRISHLSHIAKPMTMALTASKAARKPFTVQPLPDVAPKKKSVTEWLDALQADLDAAQTADDVAAIESRPDVRKAQDALTNGAHERLLAMLDAARVRTRPQDDDGWPGPDVGGAS